jgi:hypothetical protein
MLAAGRPFFDTHLYTIPQILLYVGGFLLWVPAYVAIIVRGFRNDQLEEPMLAAAGNIGWEFYWGFFVRVDMGWGLQFIYIGACILDLGILFHVFRVGWKQSRAVDLRRVWPMLVSLVLVGLVFFYWTLKREGYDLPLGSNSAYLDNILVSGLYLWFGLTRDTADLSLTVSWSKMLGTGMVSVFVFWLYPDNSFIRVLAVITAVLDLSYFLLLLWRRRCARLGLPEPFPSRAVPAGASS